MDLTEINIPPEKNLRHDASLVQAGAFVSHEDRRLCMELFHKYLREVLIASKRYKLELLAACLRLCLSAPPALIEIAPLIQPMRNALKIGLRYPESTFFFLLTLDLMSHVYIYHAIFYSHNGMYSTKDGRKYVPILCTGIPMVLVG